MHIVHHAETVSPTSALSTPGGVAVLGVFIKVSPGGGGGGYSPQILVGMCRGKVKKMARAPERAPGRAWKWGYVSGTSLSRFELENRGGGGGLRNELEPFWAWKCGAPERPLTRGAAERLKMQISGTVAKPRRCRTRWAAAVGGDERVEIKESLKIMVSGTANSAKKCKMVMLRNGFFGNLWKWYAPERKFMAENAYIMEVPPPRGVSQ